MPRDNTSNIKTMSPSEIEALDLRRAFDKQTQDLLKENREDTKKVGEKMDKIIEIMNEWKFGCQKCKDDFEGRLEPLEKKYNEENKIGWVEKFINGLKAPLSVVYIAIMILFLLINGISNSMNNSENSKKYSFLVQKVDILKSLISNVADPIGNINNTLP